MSEVMQESGRRHYVNPQPKEPARARQRANTRGVARDRKEEDVDGNLADAATNLRLDEDEDMEAKSAHSDDVEDDKDGDSSPGPGDDILSEVRVLEDVVSDVMDDMAKEVLSRVIKRMNSMNEKLMNLHYLCQAQADMLAELRMHLGPTLQVFPGKGMTVAFVRNRLVEAFWGGYFGSNNDRVVTGLVSEYEFPPTLQLVMLSVTEYTSDLVQQLIPGCYPVGCDNSTTQPQQNQCNHTKTRLQRIAKAYYPSDPWTFFCGYPMQRRSETEDGELGDEDNWSIELVVNKQVQPVITEVLLHVTYCQKSCHQTVTVDERVLIDTMGWQYSDMRSSLESWAKMYRTNIVWVGGDCSTLQVYGKRRHRLNKGDGKGWKSKAEDVTPPPRNDNFRLPSQIPQSFQSGKPTKSGSGKGKQDTYREAGAAGKPFGGQKGKSGESQYPVGQSFGGKSFGKQKGGSGGKPYGNAGIFQQFSGGPPIGKNGGFAKGTGQSASSSGDSPNFPPQMPQVPLDPSAILQALFKGGWQQY